MGQHRVPTRSRREEQQDQPNDQTAEPGAPGDPGFTRQWGRFTMRFGPIDALVHELTLNSAFDRGTRRTLERLWCD